MQALGPELEPKHHRNVGYGVHTWNHRVREAGSSGAQQPGSLAYLVSSRSVRDPAAKQRQNRRQCLRDGSHVFFTWPPHSQTCKHTHICTDTCTHVHTRVHTHMHRHMHTDAHMYTLVCTHICTDTCTHHNISNKPGWEPPHRTARVEKRSHLQITYKGPRLLTPVLLSLCLFSIRLSRFPSISTCPCHFLFENMGTWNVCLEHSSPLS